MPHLHLPLQSGSDSVLRRMARRCKTEEFAEMVKQARQQIKGFNITTDIIVGFPGETAQEWQQSFNFIKSTGFGHIHIFTYSSREGTKAATLPDQVPNEIKKQRSKQLHGLAEKMKRQFATENLNKEFSVLWEGHKKEIEAGQHLVFGYTPNYLRVACKIPNTESIENKIISAELKSIDEGYVNCDLKTVM